MSGPSKWDDAAPMQPGTRSVRIARVQTRGRDGGPLRTKGGEPCIYVTFEDDGFAEARGVYMLEGRMVFRLTKLLRATGTPKERLVEAGIEPMSFTDQALADNYLKGRRFMAKIEPRGQYLDVSPAEESAAQTSAPSQVSDDDIPF